MYKVREFWGGMVPLALGAAAEPIATSCCTGGQEYWGQAKEGWSDGAWGPTKHPRR